MKIGILAITAGGRELARQIAGELGAEVVPVAQSGIAAALESAWGRYEGLVCIMAAGIVVRSLAPLLNDKASDPAVVVVDERGRHAISLLSGHLGGGNELARRVARLCDGQAVITTASDVLELTALDLWAEAQNLVAADKESMTAASALLVNRGRIKVFSETEVAGLPPGLVRVDQAEAAELLISCRTEWPREKLLFHPRQLVVGIGCNRGTPEAEMAAALNELLTEQRLAPQAIRNLATIDLKRDEAGLLALADQHGWPLEFYSADQLNQKIVADHPPGENGDRKNGDRSIFCDQKIDLSPFSATIYRATGAGGVAEPAALLSSGADQLITRKRKWKNVTLALSRANFTLSARVREQ